MNETVQEIMCEDRFKKFRDLCRETQLEARKLNLSSELVYAGVAWDFPTMFKAKTERAWKKIFEDTYAPSPH